MNRSADSRSAGRWLPLAAFVVLGILLAAGVWMTRDGDRDTIPSPLIGKSAPEFSLPVLHEPTRNVTLAQLRGAPFVLNVWGSWCAACRDEHPVLTRFAESRQVRVIGYNWKDEPADALRWLERYGNPYYIVLSDIEGRTAIDWGVYGAPETYLVDADGVIRWKFVGPLTEDVVQSQLLPELAKAEAGS
ncbi:MAG: DsbE family thiol:disulfide interchange protein [Pseudoxanthomonas suwonensis]|nr:DsbE family thiol:disulfide interchange protein [Pseudoxanthomonas suwonensis]